MNYIKNTGGFLTWWYNMKDTGGFLITYRVFSIAQQTSVITLNEDTPDHNWSNFINTWIYTVIKLI